MCVKVHNVKILKKKNVYKKANMYQSLYRKYLQKPIETKDKNSWIIADLYKIPPLQDSQVYFLKFIWR